MWPVLLQWDGAVIYSYPLFIGLAWGLGYRLCENHLPVSIPPRSFAVWFMGLFLASWIGAKLLFLVSQNQFAVVDLALASNFWLGGGFVFLGGFLGGLLYTLLVGQLCVRFHHSKMQFTIIPLLWSHAIGRVGCLLAGCCFGVETDVPWAIHLHGADRHPVQVYEAVSLIGLAYLLSRKKGQAQFLSYYLLGYGAIRWSLEWLRGDEIRGGVLSMSTSQWVAVVMVCTGAIFYFQGLTKKASSN